MEFYWRYKDVPELEGLPRGTRREVVQACFWSYGFRHWQNWAAILLFLILVALGTLAGGTAEHVYGLPHVVHSACIMVGAVGGALIYFNVLVRQLRPHFREYIESRSR